MGIPIPAPIWLARVKYSPRLEDWHWVHFSSLTKPTEAAMLSALRVRRRDPRSVDPERRMYPSAEVVKRIEAVVLLPTA